MDDLELELRITFLGQADQLMAEAENCLLELESNPGDTAILDRIFRVVHNLKGSANAVGFEQIGDFSHVFESLLLRLKDGKIKANEPMVDLLLKSNDFIGEMVRALRVNMGSKFEISPLKKQIEGAIAKNGFPDAVNAKSTADTNAIGGTSDKALDVAGREEKVSTKVRDSAGVEHIQKLNSSDTKNSQSMSSNETIDQSRNVVHILSSIRAQDESSNQRKAKEHFSRSLTPTSYKIQPGERFLCFSLGEQEYGMPLTAVKQVIAMPKFRPIPDAPSYFVGLTNLRGKVIATLDLAKKFSIQSKPTNDRATIILNAGAQNIGVVVDAVNQVLTPNHRDLSPRPDCDPNVRTDYIISIYRRENSIILLIDIVTVLGLADWELVQAKGSDGSAA